MMARRSIAAVLLGALAISGCASVTHQRIALDPKPNECQVAQADPTMRGSIVLGVCWDKDAKPIGMGTAAGTSKVSVGLSLIGSAATIAGPVGGALILGGRLIDAAKVIDGASISATTTGAVTTTGTVGVTVPPVQVAPVQIQVGP